MTCCTKCGEDKDKEEFYGQAKQCKVCHKAYHTTRYREPRRWASVVVTSARARAKKLGVPFNLTAADVLPLPTHCPVLGIPLEIGSEKRRSSPSIDRVTPEDGYVRGNIIIVSQLANAIKTDATPDQILAVGNFYRNLSTTRTNADG